MVIFKSSYSWVFLVLTIVCLWLGISSLLDDEPDILQLRDYLAWALIILSFVSGYHFVQVTFRSAPKSY